MAIIWIVNLFLLAYYRNAFFYGLPYLSKHIVLYDTLLDQNKPEEVEAVLAHELGHWKFKHVLSMLAMSEIILIINLTLIRTCVFNPALVNFIPQIASRAMLDFRPSWHLSFLECAAPLIRIHQSTSHHKSSNLSSTTITTRFNYLLHNTCDLEEIRISSR